mmetsp:Transcript_19867/g.50420  ORF Transcript_19867/g.50420 Transcript_19867/m.50420 type:complete len:200 (-) Transcript_19867:225-824(-)
MPRPLLHLLHQLVAVLGHLRPVPHQDRQVGHTRDHEDHSCDNVRPRHNIPLVVAPREHHGLHDDAEQAQHKRVGDGVHIPGKPVQEVGCVSRVAAQVQLHQVASDHGNDAHGEGEGSIVEDHKRLQDGVCRIPVLVALALRCGDNVGEGHGHDECGHDAYCGCCVPQPLLDFLQVTLQDERVTDEEGRRPPRTTLKLAP